ncbi:unnamed protein product [Adineta steineri]|uniref:Uncharacterized protein n=1 Tax=Adineta steineri TaxID=433720 RepID=A0A815KWF3_9BILA|nr:unnamed protein product [Adineta steineri]CAF1613428.1 unnamed protein product [Adineta steineri]
MINCNCENVWYGEYCQYNGGGEQCQNICCSNFICRPNERGIINHDEQKLYCLSLPNHYRTNCYFEYNQCK